MIPSFRCHSGAEMHSVDLANLEDYDCVVLATDHSSYDLAEIAARSRRLVDTRGVTRGLEDRKGITRLGAPNQDEEAR